MFTYRVVLPNEEGVEHRQSDPPVAREPRLFDAVTVEGQRRVISQPHLAAVTAAKTTGSLSVATVDLRSIPPMRDLIDESDRSVFIAVPVGWVRLSLWHHHRRLQMAKSDGVIFFKRDFIRLSWMGLAVVYPVVVLEVDPRRRQHIEEVDLPHRLLPR